MYQKRGIFMKNNFKKKLLSTLIAGTILFFPKLGKADMKNNGNWTYTTRDVYIYNQDNENSFRIGTININQNVFHILDSNDFALINYNNTLGFVDKSALVATNPNNSISYQEKHEIGITTARINLRVEPNIESKSLMIIDEKEKIEILALANNGWYLVNYNNILGFVYQDYINIMNMEQINEQMNILPQVYKVAIATTNVNIRRKPTAESEKLGLLQEGEKLFFLGITDNGWTIVLYHGETCYIKSDYLREGYLINGISTKQIFMLEDNYVYLSPYSTIIDVLPKYETAFVYGEVGDFYLIESDGIVGYIKKNNTRELKGTYIVVDISSQQMTVYNDLEAVLTSSVVTGKNSTPTDLGYYQINDKEKNRVLRGQDYETKVTYWMPFNGGEGFHDAYWRSNFGGNIYQEHGSHGCVNLPSNIAEELYSIISSGDKVLIKK